MARICEITQPSVWKWLQSSKRLPAEYVLRVEAATEVSRHFLRPDIYPRGLVDGVPFDPEEPLLDGFAPLTFTRQISRDARAESETRIHGVDRRAGAAL